MKIALLMGGEYRIFDSCFENWHDQCLKNFEYDLFLSTWSKTNRLSDKFGDVSPTNVTRDRVLGATRSKEPYFLNIEDDIQFHIRPNKQIYHWHRLLTNLINVKDQYDFVILTRPDVFINNETINVTEFIKNCDKNKLYGASKISITTPEIYHRLTVHDIYFMGSPDVLIDMLLPVPFITTDIETEKIGRGIGMHTHLANYFVQRNIFVHAYGTGSIIDSSWHNNLGIE